MQFILLRDLVEKIVMTSPNDRIVLATVNAPYKRDISAEQLAQCLLAASVEGWPSHVVSFFTEIRTGLVLTFAAEHGIPDDRLVAAYQAMKAYSGESNPGLEIRLLGSRPNRPF